MLLLFLTVSVLVGLTLPIWSESVIGDWLADNMWVTYLLMGLWCVAFVVLVRMTGNPGEVQVR